jgi:glycosyltransferase involved in cell wall biosynthesis
VQVLDKRHGELLKTHGVRTPIVEVINGYSDVPALESLPFRTDGPPKLLYLGRFESLNKGLDLLLPAFDQIAETNDAVLTLQGPDSGDRAVLEKQAAGLKRADRVTFLPPDYTATSSDLTARHDAFILPSRFEGFSLSTLEAMLAARPVIITDIAGLSPHVRASGCGIVVDSTVDSLVDGLTQLLARRGEWKAMGLAGREYALKNLEWKTIAKDAAKEYGKLMAIRPV